LEDGGWEMESGQISLTCVLFITLLRCLKEGGLGKEVSCVFIIWVVIALVQRHQWIVFSFQSSDLARDDVQPCGDVLFHSEKKSHGIHTLCIDRSASVIWSKLILSARRPCSFFGNSMHVGIYECGDAV